MAQFDESKIILPLHPEKAEIGKKYWCADNIVWLKRKVENNESISILKDFNSTFFKMRVTDSLTDSYYLLYPYEEPKYRPYKDTEEMINDFCERSGAKRSKMGEPFIWVKYKAEVNIAKCLITSFTDNFAYILSKKYSLSELFDVFTYCNGSPIGKKE